jgi:exopolyphosphatase / guanosine-5'-triphosphate,3'-diphosphate pyrophosphatase
MTVDNATALLEEVLSLARRYNFEEEHALQDARLALRLFDETSRLAPHVLVQATGLGMASRDILNYAALLHDIGYSGGYDEHHKTSFRLIMAEKFAGMAGNTQSLVAQVARYHRGSLPDPSKHRAFAVLLPEDQQLVTQLGAILRFADGLDRTHTNAVADVDCVLEDRILTVTLSPGTGDDMERWAAQKKARWFEAVFGVTMVLRSP